MGKLSVTYCFFQVFLGILLPSDMNTVKKTGIILGSGLSRLKNRLSCRKTLYRDTNSFHNAEALTEKLFGHEVILFSGRRHFYEGYSKDEVLKFAQMSADEGADLLIITNAAGGVNSNLSVSDLMINSSFVNMLRFSTPGKYFTGFLTDAQRRKLSEISSASGLNIRFGIYCCTSGPNYESPAEIRFLRNYGIDAVGMSTVPEILFAGSRNMKAIAISCISNLLKENTGAVTDHSDVVSACGRAYKRFSKLISEILAHKKEFV